MKQLLFVDYEGTLATSIVRHYVQYVEALARLRKRFNMPDAPLLMPQQREVFLPVYEKKKKVGSTHFTASGAEADICRALLNELHSEIIWEYQAEHMRHERVLEGVLDALVALAPLYQLVMVSYTRQRQSDFVEHLKRLGIVDPLRIAAENVYTVGADGQSSRDAKAGKIQQLFSQQIAEQKNRGLRPSYAGDAVDDFLAARDVGLRFLGMTTTGKSSEAEFRQSAVQAGIGDDDFQLFPAFASEQLISFLTS
jgi:phosphoglycolate phosphatase-like HAD superfamily hydrolase